MLNQCWFGRQDAMILQKEFAMDDSLATELRLLYTAIAKTAEFDLSKSPPTYFRSDKAHGVFQDFRGGRSDEDLQNDIQLVIHNIGSLFDHLRAWARAGARGVDNVERTIQASRDLQIIMDLWNLKKHHGHDRKGGWSKLFPRLANYTSHLRVKAASGERAASYAITAAGPMSTRGNHVVVTADVLDSTGARIGDFHDIAARAVEAWKQLINKLV
jgi:hypothetical protein